MKCDQMRRPNIGRFFLLPIICVDHTQIYDLCQRFQLHSFINYPVRTMVSNLYFSRLLKAIHQKLGIFLLSSLLLLLTWQCAQSSTEGANTTTKQESLEMPSTAKPTPAHLTDVNCWSENNQFMVAALLDSDDFFWKRFWVKIALLDASGKQLLIGADSFAIIPTHSSAVPPRGRTSFTWSFDKRKIAGEPDSIRLIDAMGQEVFAGPILIATKTSSVKVINGDPEDSTKTVEVAWRVNGTLENPLPGVVLEPCIDVLLYGTDERLYFTQGLQLNQDTAVVASDRYGQMLPGDKRNFGMAIGYESLPEALKNLKIGRVDFLGYEKRTE